MSPGRLVVWEPRFGASLQLTTERTQNQYLVRIASSPASAPPHPPQTAIFETRRKVLSDSPRQVLPVVALREDL